MISAILDSAYASFMMPPFPGLTAAASTGGIVIHNYRWRLAEGEPKYDEIEQRLAAGPVISVPTITLASDANGAAHPDSSADAGKFPGKYAHRAVNGGVGHNLPQEAPRAFAQAVIDVDAF